MTISFGKKIPVATCNIKNSTNMQPCHATIFEHDCADISDYEEISNLKGHWEYKDAIAKEALKKYEHPISNIGTKIYSISTQTGKTVGLMETCEYNKMCSIEHLESHYKGLYQGIGTALLSFLAQQKTKQNVSHIFVTNPAKTAKKFYTEHCFFNKTDTIALELNREGMTKLIAKHEDKTKSPIINLKG